MRHLAGSFCSLGLGLFALCHAVLADSDSQHPGADAVVFRTVQLADSHFAVAIKSQRPSILVKRHIVVVDTSASQTGKFRENSLQVLNSLGSVLPQDHQVLVVAVDSTFDALSDDFVAPGSNEFAAAIQKLSDRTPMGATDLGACLKRAVALADVELPASLLYIGDGVSSANLLSSQDLSQIVTSMNDAQISFHAILLGPKVDTELSGILANQTGGTTQYPTRNAAQVVAQICLKQFRSPRNLSATSRQMMSHFCSPVHRESHCVLIDTPLSLAKEHQPVSSYSRQPMSVAKLAVGRPRQQGTPPVTKSACCSNEQRHRKD